MIKKLRLLFRKVKNKARKLGLSLTVVVLFIIALATITTVAIIQARRESTTSRASGTCEQTVPACIYGSYMEESGAKNACGPSLGTDYRKCRIGSTCKWECLNSDGGDDDKNYDYPACGTPNYGWKSECEKDLDEGNCTRCTNDGKTVRWHEGKEQDDSEDENGDGNDNTTQICTSTNCKTADSTKYSSDTPVWFPKSSDVKKGPLYANHYACSNKKTSKTLAQLCGSTTQNTCTSKTCGTIDPDSYIDGSPPILVFIDSNGIYYQNEANCEEESHLKTLVEICGNPQAAQSTCEGSKALCLDMATAYYSGAWNGKLLYFKVLSQCNTYINNGTATGSVDSQNDICNPVETAEETTHTLDPSTCTKYCQSGTTKCEVRAKRSDNGSMQKVVSSTFTKDQRTICETAQNTNGTQYYD